MKKLAWISASLAICIALSGCSMVKEEKKDTTSNTASSSISEEADSSSEEEEAVDFSTIEYPDYYEDFEWPEFGIGGALEVKSDNVPPLFRRYVFVGKEVRL